MVRSPSLRGKAFIIEVKVSEKIDDLEMYGTFTTGDIGRNFAQKDTVILPVMAFLFTGKIARYGWIEVRIGNVG